jgi:hypothetical protein
MSRKVKHRKMENLDPRQIQTIEVTVIKLGRIHVVELYEQVIPNFIEIAPGVPPHNYVNYSTFVTFYAWPSFPFLSFHIISLLTSTGRTGKQISMVDGSNDAFPPKEVPFWSLIEEI